jgi:TonB family protein
MVGLVCSVWRFFVLLTALLIPAVAAAQFSKLDEVGGQLAKKLKPLKPKLVAVADFTSPDGSIAGQSDYLSWFLSSSIQERGRKYLHVAEHSTFNTDLTKQLNTSLTSVTSQELQDAASRLGVDVLIIGTVLKRETSYFFEIAAIRVTDGSTLATTKTSMRVTEFLESLVSPFSAKESGPIFKAGIDGVGQPKCIYCPEPSYTNLALAKRVEGASVFEVVISAEGQVHQLRPSRLLGYGLDEEAFETIKKWKFKPATNKEGAPVPILTTIEVTFRWLN